MAHSFLSCTRVPIATSLALALATLPSACQSLEPQEPTPAATPSVKDRPSAKPILTPQEAVKLAREYAPRIAAGERARLFQQVGVTIAEQGHFPEAEELFREALSAAQFIETDREAKTTPHLINLNGALIRQEKFAELVAVNGPVYTSSTPHSMLRFASLIGIARGLEGEGKVAAASVLFYLAAAGVNDSGLSDKTQSARIVQTEYARMGTVLRESGVKPAGWGELRVTLDALETAAPGIRSDILTRLFVESERRPGTTTARGIIAAEFAATKAASATDRGRSFSTIASAITMAYGSLGRPAGSELQGHIQRLALIGSGRLRDTADIGEQRFLHLALYRLASVEANHPEAMRHLAWLSDHDAMQGFPVDGYHELLEKLRERVEATGDTVTSTETKR